MERVTVSCPHCNSDTRYAVLDKDAIPGVPDTYVQTAVLNHETAEHPGRLSKRASATYHGKPDPSGEPVTGRLEDFEHGKEHNA
jgi:hypothetical protein